MGGRCAIAMFADACGWGVVQTRPWFLQSLTHRVPAKSLFGFSSACVPAILTGNVPDQNDHWSSFYYSPETSPFKILKTLSVLPGSIFDRGRVRRYLSKGIARLYGFTGYFQIYNLPFEALPLFDYAEKYDIFRPGGINRGEGLFDLLKREGIPYQASNWKLSEDRNFAALIEALDRGETRFALLYTASLDALMHEHTKNSPLVDARMRSYDARVAQVLDHASKNYDDVRFILISDHGMATVHTVVDLMPRMEKLPLRFGEDFAAVYDSTMLRFWFFKPKAADAIRDVLPNDQFGRWVSEQELRDYGTYWPDGKFGHAVFALEPGVLLNPSHMGRVAPAGMHGYRPEHEDSDAALLANFVPQTPVRSITSFFTVMTEMARWAAA